MLDKEMSPVSLLGFMCLNLPLTEFKSCMSVGIPAPLTDNIAGNVFEVLFVYIISTWQL